jgi:hypothetical protein
MPRTRNIEPALEGAGELRFRGFRGPVQYEIHGQPQTLRLGKGSLRGGVHTTPEIAEQAFREGEAVLTLESGEPFRLVMLGHTTGGGTAYFEMRV